MSAERDLQRMIESLQELGTLNTVAAPDAAREVLEVLEDNCRRHQDPYGVPWPPRKKDGEPALDGAEKQLYCAAIDNRILMRVKGPYARHHLGKGKGETFRRQIPDRPKLPQNIIDAITRALSRHFNRMVKP